MVMPATKDLWAITTSFTALINAVNGLFNAIYLLLNTSILSADRVQGMFLHLLQIYSKNNVKTDPDDMDYVFFIRVQQHVEGLRSFSLENNPTLHPLAH